MNIMIELFVTVYIYKHRHIYSVAWLVSWLSEVVTYGTVAKHLRVQTFTMMNVNFMKVLRTILLVSV